MNFKKAAALSLSFCLLAQTALVAETNTPKSLREYQLRAKTEVKAAPWIKEDGKWLAAAGGLPVAEAMAKEITELRELREFKEQAEARIKQLRAALDAEKTKNKSLRTTNKKLEKELKNIRSPHRKSGLSWPDVYQSLVDEWGLTSRLSDTEEKEIAEVAAELIKFKNKKNTLWDRAQFDHHLIAEAEELEEHGFAAVSKKLDKFPKWRNLSEHEKNSIMELLDIPNPDYHGYRSAIVIGDKVAFGAESTPYVLRIFRALAKSPRTYVVGALLIALPWVSSQAKANTQIQKKAVRLQTNYDLFLHATPAQLAEMEENQELRQAAIDASNSLHVLSGLKQPEVEPYRKAWYRQQRAARVKSGPARRTAR